MDAEQQAATLVIIIALIASIYFIVGRAGTLFSASQRRHYWNPYRRARYKPKQEIDVTDSGHQLLAVMAAPFQKKRVLNGFEYSVFKIVEDVVGVAGRGYRVFGQTSLGEILKSDNSEIARRSTNSKRVDMLIVDEETWPVLVIECQGEGHFLRHNAAAMDEVKREALGKAHIAYLEVFPDDTDEQIRFSCARKTRLERGCANTQSGFGVTSSHEERAEP